MQVSAREAGVAGAEDERHFIMHVLAFFAASDGIVMENLAVRFMSGEASPSLVQELASFGLSC